MRFHKKREFNLELKRQIEITPLIDCVFLLLIFFMLTSNFVVTPGVNIELPQAASAKTVDSRKITLNISAEDIVYLKDKVLTSWELKQYLERNKVKSVFIKADKNSSLGAVISIWDLCKRAGIKVSVAAKKDNLTIDL
jgi:biopolymer transport protein ExbD